MLLAPDGKVFVAGQFKTVNGPPGPFLVKLDPVTGALDPSFTPQPNGMVYDIHLQGGTLYVGGTFTKLRNVVRTNFGMVERVHRRADRRTDVAVHLGRQPASTGSCASTSRPTARSLVAIGNFTQVGGQYRPNIAKLDVTGDHGHGQLVVHRRVPLRPLLVQLRHLRPRRRLLAGRQLLRRRLDRRLLRLHPPLRHRRPLGDRTAPGPSPPRGPTTPAATP